MSSMNHTMTPICDGKIWLTNYFHFIGEFTDNSWGEIIYPKTIVIVVDTVKTEIQVINNHIKCAVWYFTLLQILQFILECESSLKLSWTLDGSKLLEVSVIIFLLT